MALDLEALEALEAGAHEHMKVPESKAIVLELVNRVRRAEAALREIDMKPYRAEEVTRAYFEERDA